MKTYLIVLAGAVFFYSQLSLADSAKSESKGGANKEKIIVWQRTYEKPHALATLENLNTLTETQFGKLDFVPSKEMEQGRAFLELQQGNIDIVIAAANKKREKQVSIIHIPIDRGLLGFRVCLVNRTARSFQTIRSPIDFIEKKHTVGLGAHWPDKTIYEQNGFQVITSPVYNSLFSMLDNRRFDCFSRSISEVEGELALLANTNISIDENLVFIYPNADFIYVNPNKPELHKRLSMALVKSLEDASYYTIFDEFYEQHLIKHGIYQRSLIILENNDISEEALIAINKYGIASFVAQTIK